MDWSSQISRFKPLSVDEVPLFALPREMEQAITTYNKAIINLKNDSQDIALIALRKLAATYPLFPQAAFLLGCCLARLGDKTEAAEWIDQAILAGLPEEQHDEARRCQAFLKTRQPVQDQAGLAASASSQKKNASLPAQAAVILEKTRRRGKVRMASERERREVMRRGETPVQEETHVEMTRDPMKLLRLILPILAGALVVVTLVIAGIRWLPSLDLFQKSSQDGQRLAWLMGRLDQLSGDDERIGQLLRDYQAHFDPTPTPAPTAAVAERTRAAETLPEPTVQPTKPPAPTLEPSPTVSPSPTPDPAVAALMEAAAAYDQARTAVADDLAQAALLLVQARNLLSTITDDTAAPVLTGEAALLSEQVEALIGEIAIYAARELRLLAEPEFRNEHYEKALGYYLPAFEIYPRSYNGGVAYYLGRCYQLLGDPEAAKPYFKYVIEHFAGRDIARSAAFRLREMGY